MQLHVRRLALVFGVASLMGLSVLVACGDDATVAVPDGGFGTVGDSSKTIPSSSTSSSGTSGSSGQTDDDDDDIIDAGGADCSAAPKLHSTTKGFFCSFFKDAGPDSGSSSNCADDETCCQPGKVDGTNYGLSFCTTTANGKGDNGQSDCNMNAQAYTGQQWAASGSSTWECLGSSNCGGNKCCAFSSAGTDGGIYVAKDTSATAAPAACQPHFISKVGGSKCASDCAVGNGEIELCSSTDPCSDTSKTCIAALASGSKQLGACQ